MQLFSADLTHLSWTVYLQTEIFDLRATVSVEISVTLSSNSKQKFMRQGGGIIPELMYDPSGPREPNHSNHTIVGIDGASALTGKYRRQHFLPVL